MNSEEIDPADLKDDISTAEDDKKFVSQAVAFVIGHTRNGFVALCASVATLLKEQARLKLENDSLKQQIALLKSKTSVTVFKDDNSKKIPTSIQEKCESTVYEEKGIKLSDPLHQKKFKRKDFKRKPYKALRDCLCDKCKTITSDSNALCPPLQKGDKVVISGEICGTVCYVGHLDSVAFPEIFIGLQLDEAVGDSNGTIGRKTYFTVPQGYGLFAPLLNVCCIMN